MSVLHTSFRISSADVLFKLLHIRVSGDEWKKETARKAILLLENVENFWKDLLLIFRCTDCDPPILHEGLKVLDEFLLCRMKVSVVVNAGSIIMGEMNRIIKCENSYSVTIRILAADLFTTAMYRLSSSNEMYSNVQCELSLFFATALSIWKAEKTTDTLRKGIVFALWSMMEIASPNDFADVLPRMLPLIWESLGDQAKAHQNESGEQKVDDGLVRDILELIRVIFESYDEDVPPLVFHDVIILMGITDEVIAQWNNDLEAFVMQDDLKFFSIEGIRRQAKYVILTNIVPCVATYDLITVVTKQLEAECLERVNNNSEGSDDDRWKTREVFLLAFCLVKNLIVKMEGDGKLCFDIRAFLENVVLADLNDPKSHHLLKSRCLCVGALYSSKMSPDVMSEFLEATIRTLQVDQPATARICAAKAVQFWFDGNTDKDNDVVTPKLLALFKGLHDLVTSHLSTHESVTTLVLESVARLVSFSRPLATRAAGKICTLSISRLQNFYEYDTDYMPWLNLFKELSLNENCVRPLLKHLVPAIIRGMEDRQTERHRDVSIFLASLEVLVKHTPLPMSDLLIRTTLPVACRCIIINHYSNNLHYAESLMRTYTTKPVTFQRMLRTRDKSGRIGFQYVLRAVLRLVSRKTSYDTLTLLITTFGDMLNDSIGHVLKVVLAKMHVTEKCRLYGHHPRRLLIICAHLINLNVDRVLTYSTTLPEINGQSALSYLMSNGFCKIYQSYVNEDKETATTAIEKVIEYAVANPESSLHRITVQDGIPLLEKLTEIVKN